MTQLRIDPVTRDLVRETATGGSSFQRVDGPEEIRQHVQLRLGLFVGECFLNVNLGVRYIGLIMEKGTPPQLIESHLQEIILGTPGIVSVTEIDVTEPDALRRATCTWAGYTSSADATSRIPLHDTVVLSTPLLAAQE